MKDAQTFAGYTFHANACIKKVAVTSTATFLLLNDKTNYCTAILMVFTSSVVVTFSI